MSTRVIDASIVAAAIFREPYGDVARNILAGRDVLLAPDLIYGELANVIWKRWGRDEIDQEQALSFLGDFLSLPVQICSSANLVDIALRLAIQSRPTVYDCLYLALAVKEKSTMLTADRRLVNALAAGPLADHIAWIGDE
jgi:predicted nucleic acid-binding protein